MKVWKKWFHQEVHERIRAFDKEIRKENPDLGWSTGVMLFVEGLLTMAYILLGSSKEMLGWGSLLYIILSVNIWISTYLDSYLNMKLQKDSKETCSVYDVLFPFPVTNRQIYQVRIHWCLKQIGIRVLTWSILHTGAMALFGEWMVYPYLMDIIVGVVAVFLCAWRARPPKKKG